MNITKRLTWVFTVALIALTVVFAGCERVDQMIPELPLPHGVPLPEDPYLDKMPESRIPDTYATIGIAVALTGEYAQPYGLPMQRGLDLALEEINAAPHMHIQFVTVDAQSTVAGGVAAVQQLVDQGVPAIIGIGISTHLEEAFPIAQENGVVAFSPISSAAGLSSIGAYVFRTGLATNILNPRGVRVTHEKLGYTKAAVIYDAADTYSTSSNEEITKALNAIGVEIVAVETFQTGDSDFSTQLTSIRDTAPEVVFISALTEIAQILIQGRAIGIPETVTFIVPELGRDEVQQAGAAAEGTIGFANWSKTSQTPGNAAFVATYQATYGIDPEPWAAQAYATLYILAYAIEAAPVRARYEKGRMVIDAEAIRYYLSQTQEFPTILGNFSFDANGEALYDPIVLIVKDGTLEVFE